MGTRTTRAPAEHVIWQDEDLDPQDWVEGYQDFLASNELPDDSSNMDAVAQYMHETNSLYLNDERANLAKIIFRSPILVIGEMNLWYGKRIGHRLIRSGRLSDCLTFISHDYESGAWFVDERGELRGRFHHHDGTNYHWYRGLRSNANENTIERLIDKINRGDESYKKLLSRISFRLGDFAGDVYGWSFANRPKVPLT